jgi:hypothetical protein
MNQKSAGIDVPDAGQVEIEPQAHKGGEQRQHKQ